MMHHLYGTWFNSFNDPLPSLRGGLSAPFERQLCPIYDTAELVVLRQAPMSGSGKLNGDGQATQQAGMGRELRRALHESLTNGLDFVFKVFAAIDK